MRKRGLRSLASCITDRKTEHDAPVPHLEILDRLACSTWDAKVWDTYFYPLDGSPIPQLAFGKQADLPETLRTLLNETTAGCADIPVKTEEISRSPRPWQVEATVHDKTDRIPPSGISLL